jgi:exosortase
LLGLFKAAGAAPQPATGHAGQRRNLLAVLALPVGLIFVALPLPYSVETEVTGWLQHVSTAAAVFVLQLLGQPVFAAGNVLQSGAVRVGVAEACSGLHLLSTQVVLAIVIAFWTVRPTWQRAVLVACSPLVAVATNAIRLAAMVIAHRHAASLSVALVHDILGWLMAPLALAAVGLEIQLLRWIAPEASPANGLAGGASNSATVSAFVSGRSTWNAT